MQKIKYICWGIRYRRWYFKRCKSLHKYYHVVGKSMRVISNSLNYADDNQYEDIFFHKTDVIYWKFKRLFINRAKCSADHLPKSVRKRVAKYPPFTFTHI